MIKSYLPGLQGYLRRDYSRYEEAWVDLNPSNNKHPHVPACPQSAYVASFGKAVRLDPLLLEIASGKRIKHNAIDKFISGSPSQQDPVKVASDIQGIGIGCRTGRKHRSCKCDQDLCVSD